MAAIFIDYVLVTERGPLDVVIGVVRHLGGLLGRPVIAEQVHRAVTVGAEIHLVSNPHWEDVLCVVVGDVLDLLRFEVVNPHIVGHTAAIVFPSAELTHHAVVGNLLAIRRIRNPATFGQGQLLGQATVDVGDEKLANEVVPTLLARTENDVFVVLPRHDDVVRTHAVADVIAAQSGRVSQAHGCAAFGIRHDVNLCVSIILCGEGQMFAIGRETRKHLIAQRIVGDFVGNAALDVDRVQVSAIAEHHVIAVDGREAQHFGFLLGGQSECAHQ